MDTPEFPDRLLIHGSEYSSNGTAVSTHKDVFLLFFRSGNRHSLQLEIDIMRLFEGTPFDRPPRCEHCDRLEEECICPPPETPRTPPEKQTARLSREKRKRGKQVTLIRDLCDEADHLHNLLTTLKNHCGAGGTIDEGTLEIQGDQVEKVREKLKQLGYRTKG